ncbi:hypothetical protein BD626DRAFT_3216 [Schizophyllum amplum]|uniref:Uncharacterized protein n=1 Tax=Schizophyllum amplum TaxID=97359 RepID=A0A550CVX1_9AGAR|nr:hypothetical protein BD626DRAFT_3216 [Auriculariopsis ampla]
MKGKQAGSTEFGCTRRYTTGHGAAHSTMSAAHCAKMAGTVLRHRAKYLVQLLYLAAVVQSTISQIVYTAISDGQRDPRGRGSRSFLGLTAVHVPLIAIRAADSKGPQLRFTSRRLVRHFTARDDYQCSRLHSCTLPSLPSPRSVVGASTSRGPFSSVVSSAPDLLPTFRYSHVPPPTRRVCSTAEFACSNVVVS